jgi:hypothetical protein
MSTGTTSTDPPDELLIAKMLAYSQGLHDGKGIVANRVKALKKAADDNGSLVGRQSYGYCAAISDVLTAIGADTEAAAALAPSGTREPDAWTPTEIRNIAQDAVGAAIDAIAAGRSYSEAAQVGDDVAVAAIEAPDLESPVCHKCQGYGEIHECVDDVCLCMYPHEDTMHDCPECGGTGKT